MPYSFSTSKRGQPLYKDKTAEFILSPTCPLFGGSTSCIVIALLALQAIESHCTQD